VNSLKATAGAGQDAEMKLRTAQMDVQKLQAALKQSGSNAEGWQKTVAAYQKEYQDLKAKVQKMIDLQKGFASVLS